jgi:hypothetical protein
MIPTPLLRILILADKQNGQITAAFMDPRGFDEESTLWQANSGK